MSSRKQLAQSRVRVDTVLLNFFRAHKELAPCEANALAIERKADELLLSLDDPQTPEIVLLAIGNQLAKATAAPQPPARPVVEEPLPSQDDDVPTKEWSRERLRAFIRDNAPPIRGSRDEIVANRVLPDSYTRAVLCNRDFPADELKKLAALYGKQAIFDRIDGTDKKENDNAISRNNFWHQN